MLLRKDGDTYKDSPSLYTKAVESMASGEACGRRAGTTPQLGIVLDED